MNPSFLRLFALYMSNLQCLHLICLTRAVPVLRIQVCLPQEAKRQATSWRLQAMMKNPTMTALAVLPPMFSGGFCIEATDFFRSRFRSCSEILLESIGAGFTEAVLTNGQCKPPRSIVGQKDTRDAVSSTRLRVHLLDQGRQQLQEPLQILQA